MPESNGIVQSNPMNNTHGKHTHNYSSFPDSLAYKHYMTLRFGDYTPTFVMEGVPKDEISLSARHIIDSLSLNAPFKGSIRKITESFMVPNMAILPRTWDLIYTQPANGDDVPKDANCVIQNFPSKVSSAWEHLYGIIYQDIYYLANNASASDVREILNGLMRTLIYGETFFSAGSLLSVCGYHANSFFSIFADGKQRSYDSWFDLMISRIFRTLKSFTIEYKYGSQIRSKYFVGLGSGHEAYPFDQSFRSFIEFARENPVFWFSSLEPSDSLANIVVVLKQLLEDGGEPDFLMPSLSTDPATLRGLLWKLPAEPAVDAGDMFDVSDSNLNLSRLLAYQLVCAHYYSNSAVDFIYSAELYRQYIHTFLHAHSLSHSDFVFNWNGKYIEYDTLSSHFLELLLISDVANVRSEILLAGSDILHYNFGTSTLPCISAVLGFRKSLRFGDYFVGSRPRPLAPINTDVSVNNNMVSVIDVTRSIQAQRFANSVMRSRSKVENYVRDLFGKAPAPDYHNPFYLTRQAEIIYGDEVQNTAETQVTNSNSRTANFKSGNARFTFTFHNDDAHPCIYLQIVSFDIKRAYTRSVDRQFLHLDRYDMFNPDFQYIGDQPVYGVELGYTLKDAQTIPSVFAYQGRDMEYKQRFDVASGGFVENLPGWILTDVDRSVFTDGVLDPDFIRSYNTELDQFFLSLNGFSLASYFHFVFVVNNNVSAKRAMAVDPQILD